MPSNDEIIAQTISTLKAASLDEPIAKFLGTTLVELKPGYAKVTMKLKPEYQNFNGFVFGGIIMALADQAFGYGSNSLSHPSVATQFNTHFINGPGSDDELTAECKVLKSGRRAGTSEITVTNQDGKLIAKCTGTTIPLDD